MSHEQLTDLDGYRMAQSAAESLLATAGVGVLSLAADDEAYALPMSFGYDGEDRLYFVFLEAGERSLKTEFADGTARACVTVFEVDDREDPDRSATDWASVVVKIGRASCRERV